MHTAEFATNVWVTQFIPQPGLTCTVSAYTTHQRLSSSSQWETALGAIPARAIKSPTDPEMGLQKRETLAARLSQHWRHQERAHESSVWLAGSRALLTTPPDSSRRRRSLRAWRSSDWRGRGHGGSEALFESWSPRQAGQWVRWLLWSTSSFKNPFVLLAPLSPLPLSSKPLFFHPPTVLFYLPAVTGSLSPLPWSLGLDCPPTSHSHERCF